MKTKNNTNPVKKELIIAGNATSPGIAIGQVFVFRPFTINISELEVRITDFEKEIDLLDNARKKLLEQLEYAQARSDAHDEAEFTEIFESQKAFLNDPVLLKEIHSEIKSSKLSAAYVVSKVLSEKSEYFINLENTFFRERAFDIIDLKQKLIHALLGIHIDYHLSSPSIVVAESLSPTDTVNFNRNLILGFMTDRGGKTSHSAIMARSLQIPSVVNPLNLSRILQDKDYLILDGIAGDVIINPEKATIERYRKMQKSYQNFEDKLRSQIARPAKTKDKIKVELLANVDFIHELTDVKENRADGIGLYRTEGLYIESKKSPTGEEQFKVYKKLAEEISPNPVVIRTVDLGGDKLLEGYGPEEEMNPFLGWRAIRFCLDSPEFFKTQLRAILRASVFGKIKILLPMVCCVHEIVETRKLISELMEELRKKNTAFDENIRVGTMIETPAAAAMAKNLARYSDFFSIGTNDLTQYVLAIDRTNNKVARSFNSFHPAVIDLIGKTIKAANRHRIPVSLCGEFAALPEAIPLLMGMGLRSYSVNPYYLPKVKKIIRSLDQKKCEKLYNRVRKMHQADQIENKCKMHLKEAIPDLEYLN